MATLLDNSSKCAVKKVTDNYVFDESEFPALDSKPLADRRNKKGRRNAGEAFIQRQLATKGYVTKTVVADEGVGKKRRTRLVSGQMEDFGENVQYSLNRKARWETVDAAGCVRAALPDSQVEVTAVDSYFSADGSIDKYVKNFYRLEADESISLRQARSSKGASGKSLMATEDELLVDEISASPPKVHIQYVISKAHPVAKCLVAKCPKKRRPVKAIRRAVMDVSTYSNVDDDGEVPMIDDSHYRHRENTYTLADFIQESDPPVFVRNKSTESFENQSMKSIETIDDEEDLLVDVQVELRTDSLVDFFEIPLAKFGISKFEQWHSQCEALQLPHSRNFRWLNDTKSRLFLDLTAELTQQVHPRTPLLCLTLQHLSDQKVKVFVNSALKCAKDPDHVRMEFLGRTRDTLSTLVDAVLKTCEPIAQSAKGLDNELRDKRYVYSQRLSKSIEPLSDYDVLAKTDDINAVDYPSEADDQAVPEPDMLEDDFEYVEMHDVLLLDDDGSAKSPVPSKMELTRSLNEACDECGETDEDQLLELDTCGHSFCVKCLTSQFHAQLSCKRVPFVCLNDECAHQVRTDLLMAILPLPLVAFYSRLLLAQQAITQGNFVLECPNDHEMLTTSDIGDFDQVNCARCGTHWCLGCKSMPHWPLSCAQMVEWSTLVAGEKGSNSLRAVSAEARNVRHDMEAGQKLARMMRKLTNYKVERRFVELRKTALQLVEFAYAWLYLAASEKAQVALQLKSTLSDLLNRVQSLDNEVAYSQGTSVDTAKLVEKIDRIDALVEKAVATLLKN